MITRKIIRIAADLPVQPNLTRRTPIRPPYTCLCESFLILAFHITWDKIIENEHSPFIFVRRQRNTITGVSLFISIRTIDSFSFHSPSVG